MTDSMIK